MTLRGRTARRWLVSLVFVAGCLPSPDIAVPDFTPAPSSDLATTPDAAVDAATAACAVPYPADSQLGTQVGAVIDPTISLINENGRYFMRSLYEPCAKSARFLLVRLTTEWCGPCKWQAQHTKELLQSDIGSRLQILDVMIMNSQNRPAQVADLAALRTEYDQTPEVAVTDIPQRLITLFGVSKEGNTRFPIVAVVNKQTMRIQGYFSNSDPDRILAELRVFIARADGNPEPAVPPSPLYDDRFTRDRWDQIQQMQLAADWQPPLDPTNKFETSAAAATLGRQLFADTGLSSAGKIGCITCHKPGMAFTDHLPTAQGISPSGAPVFGDRNTPWLGGLSANRFFFWDGRADSVWSQALGPFENEKEMSSTRVYVARTALGRYRTPYEAAFGPAPDLTDVSRFPPNARPGLDTWERMTAADQQLVNRTFANLGKSIAAYLRGLRPLPVAIDGYAGGDKSALTADQKEGLVRFFDVGCIQCHYGPQLSDGTFHSNYFRSGHPDGSGDYGRELGLPQLLASEFRGSGIYSDAPLAATWLQGLNPAPTDEGQFRTSSLRGCADTAPYTHGGQTATIEDLVTLYATAGQPDGDLNTIGIRDSAIVTFAKDDPRNDLLAQFLHTFKATTTTP